MYSSKMVRKADYFRPGNGIENPYGLEVLFFSTLARFRS